MASLAANVLANVPSDQVTSHDSSHTIMARNPYEHEDWRILLLNDTVEDALSKILRFGFDIDHATTKPSSAKMISDRILAWAKHITDDIPGYTSWQQIYDFTFNALYSLEALPGKDATHVGTEADLVTLLNDLDLKCDYALQDKQTEKEHLENHALLLHKACHHQDILNFIAVPYWASTDLMPAQLALLFHKICYTYKLRECLLSQVGYYKGSLELVANMDGKFEFYMYLIQMKL
jgi:hypothetical protein